MPTVRLHRRRAAAGRRLRCLPFVLGSNYRVFQLTLVLVYAIALLGLNMLTGYNGQISLGHGAFYAIGAYSAAILMDKLGVPYWATIPVAGALCFVAGFLFGLPALRLEGLYLALATFALGVAMPQILKHEALDKWTGGVAGHRHRQARRTRMERPVAGPVALLLHPRVGRDLLRARLEPPARSDRPGAWSRSAINPLRPRRWASILRWSSR